MYTTNWRVYILSLFETKRDSETDTGQGSGKLATPQREFYQQHMYRDRYSLTNYNNNPHNIQEIIMLAGINNIMPFIVPTLLFINNIIASYVIAL